MPLKHHLTTTAVTLSLAAALASPATAQARSPGCAAADGTSFALFDVFVGRAITTDFLDAGEVVTVTADSVDLFLTVATGPIWNFANLVGNIESPRFNESAAPISESWTIPGSGITGLIIEAGNGAFTDFFNFNVSCVAVAPPLVLGIPVGDVAQVAAATQHRSIGGTVARTASARLRGTQTNTATRAFTFLSTNGQTDGTDQPINAWVSFGARGYFDRLEGETTHLTFGTDYSVSANTLMGVMVGVDQTSLENDAGQGTDSDTLLIGLYGAHSFGDTMIEGYLVHAAVDYDTSAGVSFDTNRTLAGLLLSGQHRLAAGTVTPRAQLRGTWEDFPAGVTGVIGGTSKQIQASVGAEITYNAALWGTDLFPFASLDVEYSHIDEVGQPSDELFAPRVGLGLNGKVGGGILRIAMDVGRSAPSVTDVGLDLSFEITF